MTVVEAECFIEALPLRREGILFAIVPLPDAGAAVARAFQRLGERYLRSLHRLAIGRDPVATGAQRPATSEQGGTRRSTERVHIETIEAHASGGEFVDVRRPQVRVPMNRKVPVTLIIADDEEDVGSLPGRLGGVQRGERCEQQGGEEYEDVVEDVPMHVSEAAVRAFAVKSAERF